MNVRPWLIGSLLSVATALPAAAHPVTYSGTLSNVGEAAQNPRPSEPGSLS